MIKHAWTVLCKKSLIDKDTNNLSINDILERLQVNLKQDVVGKKSIINIPIEYEVVSFLYRDAKGKEEDVYLRIDLRDPANVRLKKIDVSIRLKPEHLRMRTRSKIKGLALKDSGIYTFRVSIKQGNERYKEVARLPLEVLIKRGKNLRANRQIN